MPEMTKERWEEIDAIWKAFLRNETTPGVSHFVPELLAEVERCWEEKRLANDSPAIGAAIYRFHHSTSARTWREYERDGLILAAEIERLREENGWLKAFGQEAKSLLEDRQDWPGCIGLCEEGIEIALGLLE